MFSADTNSCCSLPFSVATRRSKNRRYTLDQDCLDDSAGDIVVSSARQSYRSSIDTDFRAGNSEECISRGEEEEEDIVVLNSEDSCYHCTQRKTSKKPKEILLFQQIWLTRCILLLYS